MIVRPLRQLFPASLLAGRWIVVLVCYWDDRGTDPQNRIVTVAGYAATDSQWAQFETAAEPIFAEYAVSILHARDLHASDGEFAGWTVLKKQAFVARLCRVLSRHALIGMSVSALKGVYAGRAAESDRKRTVTPYTFCSNVLTDWVLRDIRTGKIANTEGFGFILESGNENNAEAEWNFHEARKLHALDDVMKFIAFVAKGNCRAIQMADLFAFYSRRHGAEMERAASQDRARVQRSLGDMLKIITESVPHRDFVATDFGPDAPGSRFWAGDP
jgi:hypothetical protein